MDPVGDLDDSPDGHAPSEKSSLAVRDDRDIRNRVPGSAPAPAMPPPPRGDITVAPVRRRDLRAVRRLQRRAFRPALAYGFVTLVILWALPRVQFFVARRGEEIVGCAIGDRHDGQARVINLAVDPAMRRQGIGAALLRALEAAMPPGSVLLMVEAENTAAQALYRSAGFRAVGTAADYYGRGHAGIWMQKGATANAPPKLRV